VAEAARQLNITAAGVAQRVRALETDLGARLIVRSGHHMRPTKAGMAILGHCRRVPDDPRDLRSIAGADRPAGELRLGATGPSTSGLPFLVRHAPPPAGGASPTHVMLCARAVT